MLYCAALIALPLVPVVVWLLCHLPYNNIAREWARAQRMPKSLLMQAVREYAIKLYKPQCWHWAAVLGLQRLTMIICR